MPPAAKRAACTATVKDDKYNVVKCGGLIKLGTCENQVTHILPMKTGFCSNGNCEGSAKKSAQGTRMPTCQMWNRCPCECHLMYDLMFRESDMTRQAVDNSGYEAGHGGFVMPSYSERMKMVALSNPAAANVPIVLESTAPGITPPTVTRTFAPTVSGRAQKGELESWVKEACDIWLVEKDVPYCTTNYISREVGRKVGIREPSVGAIGAVFDRWSKMGFAICERKPVRFVSYTPLGIELGLEGCKDRFKRAEKAKRVNLRGRSA